MLFHNFWCVLFILVHSQ